MARLIVESGGGRRELRFAGPITVGRAKTATVSVEDMILSREHTLFYVERGAFFVKDLESKNGTFLNGNLLRQPERLRHGDRIKAGPVLITFLTDPEDPPVPAGPYTQTAATVPAPPPPPAPARPRVRSTSIPAEGSFVRPLITIFLIGVIVVGAYVSKFLFSWMLDRVPR